MNDRERRGDRRVPEGTYHALFESVTTGVCLVDVPLDGGGRPDRPILLAANPAFERLTGISILPGLRGATTSWDGDLLELCRQAAATGRPIHSEGSLGPGSRVFEISAFRLGEARDRPVVLLIDDITALRTAHADRRQAEDALAESEARFHALADLVPDLLWSAGADGAATWYSRRWLEYTGHVPGERSGSGWIEALHPDDRAAALDASQAALAAGEPLRRECRVRSATGEHRWFLVQARPVRDAAGRIAHWLGAATDVHDRRTAREFLERRVEERTRELEQLASSLRGEVLERGVAELQVRDLLRRLVTVQEEERRRIARDIHDQMGQTMTALRINLESLAVRCASDPELAAQSGRTRQLAIEVDQSLDYLTWQLRPASLDHLGLSAAIGQLVRGWSERFGIPAEYRGAGVSAVRLQPDVETNLYRVAQEALHNIYKHAAASRVAVVLEVQDRRTVLVIEDDGRGFDPATVHGGDASGLGLLGMRERTMLVGGEFEIESAPGRGTTVFVRVPHADGVSGGARAG